MSLTAQAILEKGQITQQSELPDGIFAVRAAKGHDVPWTPNSMSGPAILYRPIQDPELLGEPDVIVGGSEQAVLKQLNRLYRSSCPGTTHVLNRDSLGSSRFSGHFIGDGFVVFTEKHFLDTRDPHLINQAITKLGSMPSLVSLDFLERDHDLPFYILKNRFTGTDLPIIGKSKNWKSRRNKLAKGKSTRLFKAGIIPEFTFHIFNHYVDQSPWHIPPCAPYYNWHPSYNNTRKRDEQLRPKLQNIFQTLSELYKPGGQALTPYNLGRNKTSCPWTARHAHHFTTDRPYFHYAKKRYRDNLINMISVWAPYLATHTLTEFRSIYPDWSAYRRKLIDAFHNRHPEFKFGDTFANFNALLIRMSRDLGLSEVPGDRTPPHEIDPTIDYLSNRMPWDQCPDSFTPLFGVTQS